MDRGICSGPGFYTIGSQRARETVSDSREGAALTALEFMGIDIPALPGLG
jgi:hypothetical protein